MIIAFIVIGVVLFVVVLLILLSITNHKQYDKKWDEWPVVTILLAVRNEEEVITRCLESLITLDYSKEKIQILIGNDASTDSTKDILEAYSQKHSSINIIQINNQVGEQRGKANVLAQLAQKATGEYYLFTDADMQLPMSWVKGMLSAMGDGVGLAIGVTSVEDSKMQDLDWLSALGMVKIMTDLNMPVTGMGNNMIVSKKAYDAIGGYENLPFSITEDYELFKYIKKKGFKCIHIFQKEVHAQTLAIDGLLNLFNQRKRWMMGAMDLPWHVIGLLMLQPIFYLVLLFLLFIQPIGAAMLFTLKIVLQTIYFGIIRSRLNLPFRWLSVIFYEVYTFVIAVLSALYFLLPFGVKWKGRDY